MIGHSINTFQKELQKLEKHLELLKRMNEVHDAIEDSEEISTELANQVKGVLEKNTDEKIFDYNANVISLYGFWETFIESIIREYLSKLKAFGTSSDTRNAKIAPRFKKSILGLFNKVNNNNPKYSSLNDKKLIDSLYVACSLEKNDFLPEAFFQSGGNYNYKEVSDCLRRLGFSNIDEELKLYPPLQSYYVKNGYTIEMIQKSDVDLLYKKLDNLVVMRNEIAHGSITGTQIVRSDDFKDYIVFLYHLSDAINQYLLDDLRDIVWNFHTSKEMEVRHYYERNDVSELRPQPVRIELRKPVMFYDSSSYPHYGYQDIVSFFVDEKEYKEEFYETHDGSEKLTLTFNRKSRKGLLVKFNSDIR